MNTLVKKCPYCNKNFPLPYKSLVPLRKFCSKPCSARALISRLPQEKQPHWKGGKSIISTGYIIIRANGHPRAHKNNYILEHRLIMEKHLGRPLKKSEDVHHINGIKTDNRIENLITLTKSKHQNLHKIKYQKKNCLLCSNFFKPKNATTRFCSKKCFGEFWRKNNHPKNIKKKVHPYSQCIWCKVKFENRMNKKKFCSRKCFQSYWIIYYRPNIKTF